MSRYLDPKTDIVFKKIFGDHPHLLKSFLNAVLPLPTQGLITHLEYLPAEQTPVIPILKRTIVDVKCTDQQGRIFIVEMQIEWSSSFMQRMLFGASGAYVKQLIKGETYELLKPVYGLGLLAQNFDHDSHDWYHHYKLLNTKNPKREIKGLQLIFVELSKFQPNTVTEKKLQVLWLRFMSEINEKTKNIPSEFLEVPEIKEALSLTEEAGYTEAELAGYDSYWDAVSTEKTLWSERFQEGKLEGLQIGETKGKTEKCIEIAKNMLAFGIQPEVIAKMTSLSKNEILMLQELSPEREKTS